MLTLNGYLKLMDISEFKYNFPGINDLIISNNWNDGHDFQHVYDFEW